MDTFADSLSSTPNQTSTESLSASQEVVDSINSTLQTILSSLRSVNETFSNSISGIYQHPYERLKTQYVTSSGISFYTHEDVELDEEHLKKDPKEHLEKIYEMDQKYLDTTLSQIAYLSAGNTHPHIGNAFATVSGDTLVLDSEKAAAHLQFIEMVRNIPISEVEANPTKIANIILTKFLQTY